MNSSGRNDPCPCGSGKKYKKCHLEADQAEKRSRLAPTPACVEPGPFAGLASPEHMLKSLTRLAKKGSGKDRLEFKDLITKTAPILQYLERKEEIEAASSALEPERADFEKLMADPRRVGDLAETLFEEDCFTPFRFSAGDIQRAFDKVGYPGMMAPDQQTARILCEAISFLADEDRRRTMSMGLLCLLPEFVATGRKLEGWLIQYVAYATVEHEEESNPFLYQMFCHGYDEWCAKKHRNDAALFRDLGIDVERLKGMTMDEIDEWLAAQASDPAKNQALEAFLGAHPELRAESVANLEAMERSSVRLLEREDCQFLLLPFAEIKPWLLRLGQRLSEERLSAEDPQQPLSEEGMARIFEDTLRPLLDGMAESIFTPQRIRELVAALTKYRSDRFNAGDKHACTLASGALGLLGRGDRAGRQYFLTGLCWSSLGAAIKNGPQEAGDVQAMEEAGEGQRA